MRPKARSQKRLALAIAVACLLAGTVLAADDARPEVTVAGRTLDMTAGNATRFDPEPVRVDENILFGRIVRNLERSGASAKLNYIADRSIAGAPHEAGELGAGETLARATRSAVKSILKDMAEEQTGLGDFLDRLQSSGAGRIASGGTSAPTSAPSASSVRIQVVISRFLTRLDVRLGNGAVATKLSITAYGNVGIDIAPSGGSRLAFHGGYDARERTADIRCLIRF